MKTSLESPSCAVVKWRIASASLRRRTSTRANERSAHSRIAESAAGPISYRHEVKTSGSKRGRNSESDGVSSSTARRSSCGARCGSVAGSMGGATLW